MFRRKAAWFAFKGWEVSRRLDEQSENPQSMDRMFFSGMDIPARDEWFLPEISLIPRGLEAQSPNGLFSLRSSPIKGLRQQVGEPVSLRSQVTSMLFSWPGGGS